MLGNETKKRSWGTIWLIGGGAALVVGMVAGGLEFPQIVTTTIDQFTAKELSPSFPFLQQQQQEVHKVHPFVELLKLALAAAMATLVTYLNRRFHGDKPLGKQLEQAQILLCVAGAMMMIIIGNSVARALGIAGAASIIRFRTPVDDPKDAVVLLLLLALGMTCGLGMFAVAGLGVFFLCLFLIVLERIGESLPRPMMLNLATDRPDFPLAHVAAVFGRKKMHSEPREIGNGAAKYYVVVPSQISLEDISSQLMADGRGIKSVAWAEAPKPKKEQA